jgi:hypothetical protein
MRYRWSRYFSLTDVKSVASQKSKTLVLEHPLYLRGWCIAGGYGVDESNTMPSPAVTSISEGRRHIPARLLVVDDHPIVRMGVRFLFANHPRFEICGEAENGIEAIEKFEN